MPTSTPFSCTGGTKLIFPAALQNLADQFARLPGIGGKTAQRLAFHIVHMPKERVEQLTSAITDARNNIRYCSECFTLTDQEKCPICSNPARD